MPVSYVSQDALEARHSIYHSAVTFMNAFANAGTSSDQFLRDNLEWLGRASNWSMFSATAALGVIHKGSLAKAMTVLGPYLPKADGTSAAHSSPYSEGGSLYALGLINAGHGRDAVEYLVDKLKNNADETVQHGAALGLGMTGLASQDESMCSGRFGIARLSAHIPFQTSTMLCETFSFRTRR
jgi:26S proteasome regulatory subunit N2